MNEQLLVKQLFFCIPVLAVGLAAAYFCSKALDRLCQHATRRAARSRWGAVGVGLLAAGIAAGASLLRQPLPEFHDEFSYLLAADTFAHGRLTNPTHPRWQYFETFHVIHQPTYASKYPPAQGLVLAIGQGIGGSATVGLWLSMGLAAGAVVWMLRGWMPPRWAFLGGLLYALQPLIQVCWAQTYWGGNVAVIGGALVLGAYPRLVRHARLRDSLLLAAGLAILANSRPFEGFVVSVPLAVAMLGWLLRRPRPCFRVAASRVVLPIVVTLAVTAAGMAYYNARVTGSAWTMPYQVYERTYGYTPLFLWQSPGAVPEYRHQTMRQFYLGWVRETFESQRTWRGFLVTKGTQLFCVWDLLLGPCLTVPLCLLPLGLRVRRSWLPLAMLAAGLGALLVAAWINPHYLAPAVPSLFLLVVQGLRYLGAAAFRKKRRPSLVVRALVLAQMLNFVTLMVSYLTTPETGFAGDRVRLSKRLEESPGQHLVVVWYTPQHDAYEEWVYNAADIDGAKVVWARSLGRAADRRLRQYFRGRRIWLLRPDESPPRLVPYPDAVSAAAGEG